MLLEAVPNLSLGPGSKGLGEVLAALDEHRSPGWALLDVHSDPDHNRSVLTLAGAPAPLLGALGAMVEAALAHATLVGHVGVHPRLGLVDVVPFVPLVDAHERHARQAALTFAARLAGEGIPVHFYGRLARSPSRTTLAFLRRELSRSSGPPGADLAPDVGPSDPHPRYGASCAGVRAPLVAYNVLLDTRDLATGRDIAREVRASEGGLPGVRALPFALPSRDGRVQVSCNLTEPLAAGPAHAWARMHELATARGVRVLEGELVGLAPRAALTEDGSLMGLARRPASLEERLRATGMPSALHPMLS